VSKASVSIAGDLGQELPVGALQRDSASFTVHERQTYRDPHRRERVGGSLGPLDEDDRVFEVRLQIAPFGRRKALETEEIEVRDIRISRIAVADREGRARHRDVDPERAAGAADERRLAGAELAGDGDDVAQAKPAREPRGDLLGLRRARGVELDAQKRPS
jgi:hypothetical protein